MKTSEMRQSKYLKQTDVGRGMLVTITGLDLRSVEMEGEPEEKKWVLHFAEVEKPLVLNATNIQLCEQACGSDDTDHWMGKRIVLYTDPNVSFGGKLVGGIRVRKPKATAPPPPPPKPEPVADYDDGITADDIPF